MHNSPLHLLKTRRYAPLFLTQAFGAFNDNAFKSSLAILLTYDLAEKTGYNPAILITIATGVFIAPFFLFSGIAGNLAERRDKAMLARKIKLAEIVIMTLAAVSFYAESAWPPILLLFATGTQSAFFGPVKYAILPQHLAKSELVDGNGLIEASTFIAILAGTLFGGLTILLQSGKAITGLTLIAVAAAGFVAAMRIPEAPAQNKKLKADWNIWRTTRDAMSITTIRPLVFYAVLGISWFWFVGALFITELPAITRVLFSANEYVANLFMAAFALGIIIGSITVGRLLKGEISAKYVPVSLLALTFMLIEFYLASNSFAAHALTGKLHTVQSFLSTWHGWRILADLVIIAAISGIYVVPLYALMQERTAPRQRSRLIAANNIINALFVLAATILAILGLKAGLSIIGLFFALAILNLVAAIWSCRLLPQSLIKQIGRRLFRLFYRVEVKGLENYRNAGSRIVLIANHPSSLDAALIGSFLPGQASFAVNSADLDKWTVKFISRFFDIMPMDPTSTMAARTLVNKVRKGGKLVVFPEVRVSVTGSLMKIYDLPGTVAHLAGARVVPVRIDGAQYSHFARLHGIIRRRLFPKITLTFLPPVEFAAPPGLKGAMLRNHIALKLHDVMTGMVFATSDTGRTLLDSLVSARAAFGKSTKILEDINRQPLSYGKLIVGIFVLGRKLGALTHGQKTVAVLLPNANACLVTLFGLQAYGRIPAMLNFSTGAVNMAAACTAASVETIITSRRFIDEGEMEDDIALLSKQAKIIYLEDIRDDIGIGDKLRGLAAGLFARTALKSAGATENPDDPAVILFTSGSEGVPKGVVLSHRNLQANIAQVRTRIPLNPSDKVFNALPIFHALGLTLGALLPLMNGIRIFLYPSPLHYKIVPELCYGTDATVLLGTNTFLAGYARNAHPYDFYSLWLIVGGAEKVRQDTREVYMEKFGKRIIEGYGATECAPVLAANTPMHFKSGTVGRLFDGISYRLEPVEGIETGGELVVKGPNIMLGYLRADNPGIVEPPADGWYHTGDIVDIDEDGYVTIIGRAKRFAKIAGEMVSLTTAETIITEISPGHEHAIVAVPDKKKGEKLVLFTTDKKASRKSLTAAMKKAGAIEMQIPRLIIHIDEIPVLRTGKTDYVTINKLAREQVPE